VGPRAACPSSVVAPPHERQRAATRWRVGAISGRIRAAGSRARAGRRDDQPAAGCTLVCMRHWPALSSRRLPVVPANLRRLVSFSSWRRPGGAAREKLPDSKMTPRGPAGRRGPLAPGRVTSWRRGAELVLVGPRPTRQIYCRDGSTVPVRLHAPAQRASGRSTNTSKAGAHISRAPTRRFDTCKSHMVGGGVPWR
jgi:hypothetical protein